MGSKNHLDKWVPFWQQFEVLLDFFFFFKPRQKRLMAAAGEPLGRVGTVGHQRSVTAQWEESELKAEMSRGR
jgi:hypothetical protein